MTGIILAATLSMGPGGPGFGMLLDPQVQEEIGLSEDQVSQVEKLLNDNRLSMIDLRASLEKKRLELGQALREDKPDEAKIQKLVKEIGNMRTQMMMARIETQLAIRNILTDEQEAKLRQMRPRPQRHKGKRGPKPF